MHLYPRRQLHPPDSRFVTFGNIHKVGYFLGFTSLLNILTSFLVPVKPLRVFWISPDSLKNDADLCVGAENSAEVLLGSM